jgi:hypothetical protein
VRPSSARRRRRRVPSGRRRTSHPPGCRRRRWLHSARGRLSASASRRTIAARGLARPISMTAMRRSDTPASPARASRRIRRRLRQDFTVSARLGHGRAPDGLATGVRGRGGRCGDEPEGAGETMQERRSRKATQAFHRTRAMVSAIGIGSFGPRLLFWRDGGDGRPGTLPARHPALAGGRGDGLRPSRHAIPRGTDRRVPVRLGRDGPMPARLVLLRQRGVDRLGEHVEGALHRSRAAGRGRAAAGAGAG